MFVTISVTPSTLAQAAPGQAPPDTVAVGEPDLIGVDPPQPAASAVIKLKVIAEPTARRGEGVRFMSFGLCDPPHWFRRRPQPTRFWSVAADPATRSPMRLATAGPWWDEPVAAAPVSGPDAAELAAMEADLADAGGLRVTLHRQAREQLTADGQPLTRATEWSWCLTSSKTIP